MDKKRRAPEFRAKHGRAGQDRSCGPDAAVAVTFDLTPNSGPAIMRKRAGVGGQVNAGDMGFWSGLE